MTLKIILLSVIIIGNFISLYFDSLAKNNIFKIMADAVLICIWSVLLGSMLYGK